MKGFVTKLEQAIYIRDNGCNSIYCLQCKFINNSCRIYPPETSPDIKKEVIKYIRKYKLKKLKK